MSPLPRWVGWLAAFAALFGGANAAQILTFLPPMAGIALVAIAVVAGALSTQLIGTGIPRGLGWLGAATACLGALDMATIAPPGCVPSPQQLCEAVRLVALFPPKVGAALLIIGVVVKSLSRANGDTSTGPS